MPVSGTEGAERQPDEGFDDWIHRLVAIERMRVSSVISCS
jgi:hypothetical protein